MEKSGYSLHLKNRALFLILNKGESYTIGSSRKNILCISGDTKIAPLHAIMATGEQGVFIQDMGSIHGTCINNIPTNPYEKKFLKNNDEITLGQTKLKLLCR
jgi:pSer/pThr/pTyr-binding forkhead associated (FHA) protein